MIYLEELEKKVLLLIEKNRELQAGLEAATKEIDLLRDQNRHFEASLLKESHTAQALSDEKNAIINTIEDLLSSINALENNLRM